MVCVGSSGCQKSDPNTPIEQIWQKRCVRCHGADGAGDGVAAGRLDPKPRDLRDRKWQTSRSDAKIGQAIIEGGDSVGRSGLMPPHPDLVGRRAELVKWVRQLAKD